MIKDYFVFAFRSVRHRRLRTWLTMIGIFIGIAAVVALISLGQGMQQAINQQFRQIGSNRLMVQAGGVFFGPPGTAEELAPTELTEKDVKVVENVKGVDYTAGLLTETVAVEFRDKTNYIQVWGTPTDPDARRFMKDIGLMSVKEGRQLEQSDKYKAIVGYKIAYEGFDKDIKVGDKLTIKDKKFEVVGIQKQAGTGVHDVIIRIPKDTARDLFGETEKVSFVGVVVKEGLVPKEVAGDVKKELRESRDIEEGEEDFTVTTVEQVISQLNTILMVVQIILIGIAAISLVVGGIGIMTTMYTSVLERTREIGIMKAVGAKNSDVLRLFLVESGSLGLVGGAIGIVIGLGLSKTAEFIAMQMGAIMFKAHISFGLIIGALAFSFIIGSISGVFPARQAALLKPVEALRGK